MNARIRKEIHSQRTIFAVIVIVAVTGSFFGRDSVGWVGGSLIGLSAFMGASVFGTEFQARTMGLLLSQPLSRRQLWYEKMTVFGGTLFLSWLIVISEIYCVTGGWSRQEDFLMFMGLTAIAPLMVFCSAPCLTLICRSFIAGIALPLILPGMIFLVLMFLAWLGGWLLSKPEPLLSASFEENPVFLLGSLGLIYSASMYFLGYYQFLNFQVVDTQARELSLPDGVENRLAPLVKKLIPGYTGPMASLIHKELQVQRPTFVCATVLFVATLCAWLASEFIFKPDQNVNDVTFGLSGIAQGLAFAGAWIYLVVVPLIAGVVCMTEERSWGTLNWQTTFPVSMRRQTLTKLAVTYSTVIFLGLIIPTIVAVTLGRRNLVIHSIEQTTLLTGFFLYLPVFSLIVFASSVSTNTVRAIVLFFSLFLAIIALTSFAFDLSGNLTAYRNHPAVHQQLARLADVLHITIFDLCERIILAVGMVFVLGLTTLSLVMSYLNHRLADLPSRRRWLQPSILLAASTLLSVLFAWLRSLPGVFSP